MYINRESLGTVQSSQSIPSSTVIVMETHSAYVGEGEGLVPTGLNNVFIRAKQSGWNVEPDSGEWQSAWYSPSGSQTEFETSVCR